MRLIALCLIGLTLVGCVSTRTRHGFVIERGESALEAMNGVDSKDSVLARYGEPSMRPAISDDVWYYVSSATNTRAFYRTQTMARSVTAFRFDDDGMVETVEKYELADGKPIELVDRVTRTRGKELTVLEQLIGGVGQMPGAVDPDGATGP